MTDKIKWTGSPDGQIAKVEDYVLRVETLEHHVWWCMRFTNLVYKSGFTNTIETAKTAAINAMNEHENGKN